MKPALTAEEWAVTKRPQYYKPQPCIRLNYNGEQLSISEDVVENGEIVESGAWVDVQDAASRHALAALALHNQPYGFTWEDVDAVRDWSVLAACSPSLRDQRDVILDKGLSLMDRIAALLPPR